MAAPYNDISRAAYQMAPHAAPLTVRYRALPFPEAWNPTILDLCNLGRSPDAEQYRTVPTYRMDGVLQSLAPDLIVRSRLPDTAQRAGDAWLYVPADLPDPLPAGVLDKLLGVWLRDLRPEAAHLRDVQSALAELMANPPQWFETSVDILGCPTTAGGTAAPYPRQYQLATDHVARAILGLGPYDTGAGTLQFRAVPRGPRQQGAELISQPLPYDVKERTWWYSIVIAVTLHTVPFDPQPRLHLHTGVRRWATHPDPRTGRVRLPYGVATSVYLKPSLSWFQGTPLSERHAVARLAFDRTTRSHEWGGNGPASILRRIHLTQPFPDPTELLTDPARWIGDGAGVRAAIVHSNRMGSHAIGAGLMSHQRSQITEWAEQALPEGLRRVPKLSRSRAGGSAPDNARPTPTGDVAKKAEQARAAGERRIALAVAVQVNEGFDPVIPVADVAEIASPLDPPKVTLRLLWQTPALRDAAIEAIAENLGLEGSGRYPDAALKPMEFDDAEPGRPALLLWKTPQLTVELRCLRLTDGIADTLGIDPTARPRGQALAAAIKARRMKTRDFLLGDGADPCQPALALVEIDRKQDFGRAIDDPKFAVRLGCADAGVLTQFVVVPKRAKGYNSERNLSHRVRSGWQDGLRQLGVRVLPEHAIEEGIPKAMRYVATWMVKRRKDGPTRLPRHMPVAVMVSPIAKGSGLSKVTGWDPKALEWIPYPKFLLRLVKFAEIPEIEFDGLPEPDTDEAGGNLPALPHQRSGTSITTPQLKRAPYQVWRQDREEQRKETARYLQKMIRSLRGAPTMLLTHSQNSRMHWPWLQDSQTEMDLIRTGHAPPAGLDADLRMIRIRDADGRETPQWWGNAGKSGINGLPPGLWIEKDDAGQTLGRSFYSTTAKASTFRDSAVEADKLAPRPLRQGINKGKPTVDTHIPAWNPALIEIIVLACHADQGDIPEALALAVHQLRQAPDYLDALSMPLPMHLASLAQQYVLPTVADSQADVDADYEAELLTSQTSTLGLIINPPMRGDIDLDVDPSEAPGLSTEPDDLSEIGSQAIELAPTLPGAS
jgi:hypothetical protein